MSFSDACEWRHESEAARVGAGAPQSWLRFSTRSVGRVHDLPEADLAAEIDSLLDELRVRERLSRRQAPLLRTPLRTGSTPPMFHARAFCASAA